MWNLLRTVRRYQERASIGVDIGTSSVKVVQLRRSASGTVNLDTYGQLATYGHIHRFNNAIQTPGFRFFKEHVVKLIATLLERAEVTAHNAVFSVPVFSSFVTTLDLPAMTHQELQTAIPIEARQYVPTSLAEVALSWSVVGEEAPAQGTEGPNRIKVLLVAVPKEVVQRYIDVAEALHLTMTALELETLAFARSSLLNVVDPTVMVDIGSRSSDISLVVGGAVRLTYNLDVAGEELAHALERRDGNGRSQVELEKEKRALPFADDRGVVRPEFSPVASELARSVKKIIAGYEEEGRGFVRRIVVGGGVGAMKGIDRWFSSAFPGLDVSIADPWRGITVDPVLAPALREIAPAYAVVAGLALRGVAVPEKAGRRSRSSRAPSRRSHLGLRGLLQHGPSLRTPSS